MKVVNKESTVVVNGSEPDAGHDLDRPLQFGLRTLLIIVAVCCVSLGLFRLLGTPGGVVCWVVAAVFTWIVKSRYSSFRQEGFTLFHVPPKWQRVLELIWGVAMPVACLFLDPFLFRSNPAFFTLTSFQFPAPWSSVTLAGFVQLYSWSIYCYVFCLVEAGLLCIAMFRPPPDHDASIAALKDYARFSAFLSGALQVGSTCALLAAIVCAMMLASVILFGLGVLLLTPWYTFAVYKNRSRELATAASLRLDKRESQLLQLAGALSVAAATFVSGFALTSILKGLAPDLWAMIATL